MRRDHSAFVSGFTGALGVLAAVLLCALASAYWVREQARENAAKQHEQIKDPPWRLEHAKQIATPHLAKYGVHKLSDDAQLATLDGKLYLIAHGLDESNRLRKVLIHFDVGSFDGKEHWKLVTTMIDDRVMYDVKKITSE